MSYPFDQFAAVAGANRQLALKCAEIMREAGQRQAAIASRTGSVAKIVKLEHAWRRLDGRNDDGFQVAPFPG